MTNTYHHGSVFFCSACCNQSSRGPLGGISKAKNGGKRIQVLGGIAAWSTSSREESAAWTLGATTRTAMACRRRSASPPPGPSARAYRGSENPGGGTKASTSLASQPHRGGRGPVVSSAGADRAPLGGPFLSPRQRTDGLVSLEARWRRSEEQASGARRDGLRGWVIRLLDQIKI